MEEDDCNRCSTVKHQHVRLQAFTTQTACRDAAADQSASGCSLPCNPHFSTLTLLRGVQYVCTWHHTMAVKGSFIHSWQSHRNCINIDVFQPSFIYFGTLYSVTEVSLHFTFSQFEIFWKLDQQGVDCFNLLEILYCGHFWKSTHAKSKMANCNTQGWKPPQL